MTTGGSDERCRSPEVVRDWVQQFFHGASTKTAEESICETDRCWATRNAELFQSNANLKWAVMDFGFESNLVQDAWNTECVDKKFCEAGEWLNHAPRDVVFRVPPLLRCVNYRLFRLEELATLLSDQRSSVNGHLGRLVMEAAVDWSQCFGPTVPLGSVQMCEPQFLRQLEWVTAAGSKLTRTPRPQQSVVPLLKDSGVCIQGGATRLGVRRVYATAAETGGEIGLHPPLDLGRRREHRGYDGLSLPQDFLVSPRSATNDVVEGFWRKVPDEDTRRPTHSLIPVRLKRPGKG